ncbi:MAG: hypothetical protein AB8G05_00355 [Oligoflexales bacterium]
MTDPNDIVIYLEKESIRSRIKTLAVLLGLVIVGMGYLSYQMPDDHLPKIFGIQSS